MAFISTKKKSKKQSKKALKQTKKSLTNAERAVEEFNKLAAYAGPLVSEGAREARDKAAELIATYGPQVESRVRTVGGKASDAAHLYGDKAAEVARVYGSKAASKSSDLRKQGVKLADDLTHKVGPGAEKLRADIVEDYFPRAKRTAQATNSVLSAATLAALDAARKEFDKGQVEIKKAATKPAPKKGGFGKVLLVLTLAAAGAGAGYVAWKKTRPVEDPWAPPADFARAHYPAAANTDSDASAVSDSVASADAGDVASALKGEKADSAKAAAKPASDTAKGAEETKVDLAPAAAPTPKDVAENAAIDGNATAKVIDPAGNRDENPADPLKGAKAEKRGAHRNDA